MRKNIGIILLTVLVFCIFLMCSGTEAHNDSTATGLSIKANLKRFNIPAEIIPFDYSVSDGMIETNEEKEAMIEAKIKHLQDLNKIFWGPAPEDLNVRAEVFDGIWEWIGNYFAGFKGLDLDWDEFYSEYYPLVRDAVDYGQFAYAMTMLAYSLEEGHSLVIPGKLIGEDDEEYAGCNSYFDKAPVFNPTNLSRLAVCFTVTYDGELVITKIADEEFNPYNFKIGDEILGFNGVSWHDWLPALEKAGIPIVDSPAAAKGARKYNLLRSAMANVNLFEKINIKRINTGEIETMEIIYIDPTELMLNCTELTETKGLKAVGKPGGDDISWKNDDDDGLVYGIIKDKNIGYIYLKSCPSGFEEFDFYAGEEWKPEETKFAKKFEKAILSLMNTDGIIFDLRYNLGGRTEPMHIGLAHLLPLDEDVRVFTSFQRDESSNDRTAMIPNEWEEEHKDVLYLRVDEPNLSYDKPIIAMTGPDCVSACDVLVAFFSKYPDTFTIIGRDTNASFAGVAQQLFNMEDGDFIMEYLTISSIVYSDDIDKPLLRSEDFLDIPVWFNKEDVINNMDTMREFAFKLIKEGIINKEDEKDDDNNNDDNGDNGNNNDNNDDDNGDNGNNNDNNDDDGD